MKANEARHHVVREMARTERAIWLLIRAHKRAEITQDVFAALSHYNGQKLLNLEILLRTMWELGDVEYP
jgi:hypothetical protein